MEHYPDYNGNPEAEEILSGFGLAPDSPFIKNSAAYHDRESAPANSLILQRVNEYRSAAQRAAAQQSMFAALFTGFRRA